jgi:TolA protein
VRTSLVLSVILHIAVLTAVLFNFHSSTPKELSPQPITVELVSASDVTQVKAGKKTAPDQEASHSAAPEEKKPEPAPKAPEPPKPVEKAAEKQAVPPPPKAAEPEPEKKVVAKPEPAPAPEPKREEPKREDPKPAEKPKPEHVAEAKPKKPEPKPEPKPEAKPEPKPERDPTPFRDRVADLLKAPGEEPKPHQPAPPAQAKRDFDADRIAALLNRDPKAAAPVAQEGPKEPWRKPSSLQDQAAGLTTAAPARDALGAPSGQDPRMSSSEIDYFRSQISRCWTPPVGGLGGEDIVVKLRIELNRDGTLVRAPQLANTGSSGFFTAAADSAVRAVFQCQPYTMPADKYGQWRDMLLNFDPRRMYGG